MTFGALLVGTEANARYFSPETGNFLSPDRAGMIDGPNLYRYVQNQPTLATDPFGDRALVLYGEPGRVTDPVTKERWNLSEGNRTSFENAVVIAVTPYLAPANQKGVLIDSWFTATRDPSRYDDKGVDEVVYVGHGDLLRPLLRPLPDRPVDVVDFTELVKKVSAYGAIHILGCNTANTGFAQAVANQTRVVEAVDENAHLGVKWSSSQQVTSVTLSGNTLWYRAGFDVNLRPHPRIATPP